MLTSFAQCFCCSADGTVDESIVAASAQGGNITSGPDQMILASGDCLFLPRDHSSLTPTRASFCSPLLQSWLCFATALVLLCRSSGSAEVYFTAVVA